MSIKLDNYNKKRNSNDSKESGSSIIDYLNKDISIGGKRFDDKKKAQFYNDMYTLLDAGLDLNSTMQILNEEAQNQKLNIYNDLQSGILVGKSLAMVMKETGNFSVYEYQSVKIGEETGQLPRMFEELKNHFDKKVKLRQQFISLITYPAIVISLTIGVLIFLMNYVVPMFIGFLEQVNAELPAITQFVLDVSEFVNAWYKIFFLFLIGLITFLYFQRTSEWFKKYSSIVLLRMPLFGKMFRRIYLTRFCQSMALLTSSKIPLVEALEMTAEMVDFYPITNSLNKIKTKVLKGETLHEAMEDESIFESRMISMVRVGEEVNRLDQVFLKISDQYNDSIENQTKVIKSVIEPILILTVGVIVAIVAMAMILPIFKMSSTMDF